MIGKKLKEYRQTLKVTGETLANLSGIKRSYLSQIENEKKVPPIDTFMNLVNSIAKISPITDENAKEILIEDLYQEFKALLKIDLFYIYSNSSDINDSNNVIENVGVTAYTVDNSNIEIGFGINKKNIELVTEDDIDAKLRSIFFNEYKEHDTYNITDDYYNEIVAYEMQEVRQSLYEWWYNHILQDIMKSGIRDSIIYSEKEISDIDIPISVYNSNISEGDQKLLAELWPLMNENGVFTPYNDDDNTNISKDLLNGKTVTFDIRSITDKNVRALLDGQLLSNEELTAITFTLNGIRYNRNSKIFGISTQWVNEALKESKKEIEQVVIKEIGKLKFDGKQFGANRLEEETIQIKDLPLELQSDMARKLIKELVIKDGKIDIHYNF